MILLFLLLFFRWDSDSFVCMIPKQFYFWQESQICVNLIRNSFFIILHYFTNQTIVSLYLNFYFLFLEIGFWIKFICCLFDAQSYFPTSQTYQPTSYFNLFFLLITAICLEFLYLLLLCLLFSCFVLTTPNFFHFWICKKCLLLQVPNQHYKKFIIFWVTFLYF